MIVAAILATTIVQGRLVYLGDPASLETRSVLSIADNRLEPPKTSPRRFSATSAPWEFDWVVAGLGRTNPAASRDYDIRFRVFSQLRKQKDDIGTMTARMAMRLWEYNVRRLKIDHSEKSLRIVDFYLCWGGEPGSQQGFTEDRKPVAQVPRRITGEHYFDMDAEGNPPTTRPVNTIYIFDLANFTDPVEMAREVAHEYGHAVLPAIGGFGQPEDWGNGDVGERIYLRYLRDELKAGRIKPIDAMGCEATQIGNWVAKYVDPGILNVAKNGPRASLIDGKGQDSLNAFASLASYAEAILPPNVFAKSMQICGPKAKDYPDAIVEACKAAKRVVIAVPAVLQGKEFWVPLAGGKLTGGSVLKKNGDWALVKPLVGGLNINY